MSILDVISPTDRFPQSLFTYAQSGPCGASKAPEGWHCTRDAGHDGPCAAVPDYGSEAPDPKQHFWISMLKSAIRIIACLFFAKAFPIPATLLVLAEFIGIIEELV